MTRLVTFYSLALALSAIPTSVAGPACARKHYQTANCLQECKSKWGWTGRMMGVDRWGSVINTVGDSEEVWDSIIAKACGSSVLSVPDVTSSLSVTGVSTYGPVISANSVPLGLSSSTPVSVSSPVVSVNPSSTISSVTPTSSNAPISSSVASTPQITVAPATTRFITSVRPTPRPVTTERPTTSQAQPTTTVAPPPPAQPAQNSESTSSSDIQAYLTAHNSVRASHSAQPLTWSDELASKAQQWANGCKFQHSGGSLGPFGENLAAGTGSSYGIAQAVKSWTDEVSEYDPNNPVPSHFTQVVWKASKQVGCAVQECDGIFSAQYGKAKYYVCEYSPAGNVIGQFPENVQA